MYSEKYFKNHILWIRIKRVFFMLICSIIGCLIGVISSSYIVDILLFDWNLKPIIIAGSTIFFFFISLLITSNSSRYVQDCLWKIETLHTLNNLSDKLDSIKALENNSKDVSNYFSEIKKELIGENELIDNTDNSPKNKEESDLAQNNTTLEDNIEKNVDSIIEIIQENSDDDISTQKDEQINEAEVKEFTKETNTVELNNTEGIAESSISSKIQTTNKSNPKKKNRKKNKGKSKKK